MLIVFYANTVLYRAFWQNVFAHYTFYNSPLKVKTIDKILCCTMIIVLGNNNQKVSNLCYSMVTDGSM